MTHLNKQILRLFSPTQSNTVNDIDLCKLIPITANAWIDFFELGKTWLQGVEPFFRCSPSRSIPASRQTLVSSEKSPIQIFYLEGLKLKLVWRCKNRQKSLDWMRLVLKMVVHHQAQLPQLGLVRIELSLNNRWWRWRHWRKAGWQTSTLAV